MSDTTTEVKKLSQGRVECTVTFTEAEVGPAEKQALEHLGADVKLEGFRPGKAPADLVRSKVDAGALMEETIRNLLPQTFERLVKDNDIKTIAPPKIEVVSQLPLKVKIIFVEKPEVKIKGMNKIKIEKKESKVDEKDIQQMIDYILKKHQQTKEVDRAAGEGDQVTMDFWGESEDKKEIPEIRATDYKVIIGSKTLLPGFEDNLNGMKKGNEKAFELTFPEKYQAEHLQGKPVTFHVTIKSIEEVTLPKLTDEFVKKELQAESEDDFRKKVKEGMQKQEEEVERKRRENLLMEELRKATIVDLAPELIEDEAHALIEELGQQLSQQNLTMAQWIEKSGKKTEEIEKEMRDRGEKRLTLRLGIQKIMEEKEIDVSDEEMAGIVGELLAPLPESERSKVNPAYEKGQQAYEQLKWQKKVEKIIDSFLSE